VAADPVLLGQLDLAEVVPGEQLAAEYPPLQVILERLDRRNGLKPAQGSSFCSSRVRIAGCVTTKHAEECAAT
jgi:hypothetical protein